MTTTTSSGGVVSTARPVDAGCTTNHSTGARTPCYDRRRTLMNTTRTATFVLGAGALAALIAGATTSGRRPAAVPPIERARPIELQGAELAAEIARLQERLRPTAAPSSSRNLFMFGALGRRATEAVPTAPEVMPPPTVRVPAPTPPRLVLVGLAEDVTEGGPVRTAIVSGFGDIFLVKAGETVASRYRVVSVASDGVELVDETDGSTVRLSLK